MRGIGEKGEDQLASPLLNQVVQGTSRLERGIFSMYTCTRTLAKLTPLLHVLFTFNHDGSHSRFRPEQAHLTRSTCRSHHAGILHSVCHLSRTPLILLTHSLSSSRSTWPIKRTARIEARASMKYAENYCHGVAIFWPFC